MTHEYGDAISPEAIDLAATRALELHQAAPDEPLDEHVAQAAKETVCACVLDLEDEIEGGLSGTHAAVLREVSERIWLRLTNERREADDASVDEASDESFPASDAPAWIWRGHSDKGAI